MDQDKRVVNWAEKLAGMAANASAAEVVSGKFISFRSGVMTYNDVAVPGNSLLCIVLDSLNENHYYEEAFNPNNITSPVCFAFGRGKDGMAPHPESLKPQADQCEGCAMAEWASDPKGGRGKACKEIRRLAIIPAEVLKTPEKIMAENVGYARVPVMSVKNWSNYVNVLAAQKLPPLAAVTRMYLLPDAKSQFSVNFELMATINDEDLLSKLFDKAEAGKSLIDFPYEKPNAEKEVVPTAQKAAAKATKLK